MRDLQILRATFGKFCATFQLVFLWYNCLWHRCTIQSIVACWST